MMPISWASIAILLAGLIGGFAGHRYAENAAIGQRGADAITASATQAVAVKAAIATDRAQRTESSKVETVYVDRIQTIKVPVPVYRTRLVRSACLLRKSAGGTGDDHGVPVPGGDPAQPLDAAIAADPDATLFDDTTAEIPNAVGNTIQLDSLQAYILANTAPENTP